jgi:energy-coupling factor transporter ATP-binding protein EcfA2
MSTINRIEVAHYLNIEQIPPHQPDWKPGYIGEVFNFRGENTAITGTNGIGKTSLNQAFYAIVARTKGFVSYAKAIAAPKRSGAYSHVRIEVLFRDKPVAPLLGQIGAEVPGEPHVLAFYGYSDDNKGLRFYTYQGTLEDCPVSTQNGTKRKLISNRDFINKLNELSVNNTCQQNLSESDWLNMVARHFDKALIDQMVSYQKSGGGDGVASMFNVMIRKLSGKKESYDTAFFYQHLAPQVLSNAMAEFAEENEISFADSLRYTILPIIGLEDTKRSMEIDLAEEKKTFYSIEKVKVALDQWRQSEEMLKSKISEISSELSFVFDAAENSNLPGIPTFLDGRSEKTRFVANNLYLNMGEWLIPDRLIAEMFGSATEAVNKEADRLSRDGYSSERRIKLRQPIEILAHLKTRDKRGKANSGYSLDFAVVVVQNRTEDFADGWNKESAERALRDGYAYRTNEGETNPFRSKHLIFSEELKQVDLKYRKQEQALITLQERLGKISSILDKRSQNQEELALIRKSGLFSDEELEQLNDTFSSINAEFEDARKEVKKLEDQNLKLAEFRNQYHAAGITQPHAVLEELRIHVETTLSEKQKAEEMYNESMQSLNTAFQSFDITKKQLEQKLRKVSKTISKGLSQVNLLLEQGEKDSRAMTAFSELFGNQLPHEVYEQRTKEQQSKLIQLNAEQEKLDDLLRQLEDLENAQISASQPAHNVLKITDAKQRVFELLNDICDTSKTDRKVVMSHFSSVLHAPVASSADEAQKMLQQLSQEKIESPIFSAQGLINYCKSQNVQLNANISNGLLFGEVTPQVRCLIEPEAIEEEKQVVSKSINDTKQRLELLEEELEKLDISSDISVIVSAAVSAFESEALTGFEGNLEKKKNLESAELAIEEWFTSEENLTVCQERLKEFDEHVVSAFDIYAERKERHVQSLTIKDEAEAEYNTAKERANSAQSDLNKRKDKLVGACEFVDLGGVEFDQNYEELKKQRLNALSIATDRKGFRWEQALIAYMEEKEGNDDAELGRERDSLERDIIATEDEKNSLSDQRESLQSQLHETKSKAIELDLEVFRILKHRSDAQKILSDIDIERHTLTNDAHTTDLQKAQTSLNNLKSVLADEEVPDIYIVDAITDINEDIDELNLGKKTKGVNSFKTNNKHNWNEYIKELNSLYDDDKANLTDAAKNLLKEAFSRTGTNRVNQLFKSCEDNLAEISTRYEKILEDIEKRMDELSERINILTVNSQHNFDLLCSSLRPISKEDAGLYINAEMVSNAGIREAIENVVELIRTRTEDQKKSQESGFYRIEASEFNRVLNQEIDRTLYRSIFKGKNEEKDPQVDIVHPAISKRRKRLDAEISTGQKQAIGLMVAIKLADYAINRDEIILLAAGKRKRLKSAHQTRVIMIDGLFSNLSNEKLIYTSVAKTLQNLKGKFQLIGWIHNEYYESDQDLFPERVSLRKLEEGFATIETSSTGDDSKELSVGEGNVVPLTMHIDKDESVNHAE